MQRAKTGSGRVMGERHPFAKLSDHEVELIRILHDEGMSYSEIAMKMEVSKSSVADLCTYRRRAFIAGKR